MERNNNEEDIAPVIKSKGLSVKGIIQVLINPTTFFKALKDNPKILIPYLAIAVFVFIFMFTMSDLILQAQIDSPQFQKQMQGQQMTPQMMTMIKYNIVIGGTLAMLLAPLLAAALALFWGNFVFAGQARFKQILSVILYGEIIFAIGLLVHIPLMLAKGSVLVSLSLAVLAANMGPESFLYVALSKVSLFLIWELIAIGIGLSILYDVPRNKGYVYSLLSVGMLSILHVVFTGIAQLIF